MTPRPEIRIADSDREAAVAALGEHYAAGRLTKEEYDERADRAWAARTNSDQWPLFVDLPAPATQRRVDVPAQQSRRSGVANRGPLGGWSLASLLLMLLAVLLVVGIAHRAFPLFLLFFGVWFLGPRRHRRDRR